jgi:hypothetical protein
MADDTFATAAVTVATFGMTAGASIGIYQALFVFPEYFSDPPGSLRRYQEDKSWSFWLPLHAVTLIALVCSLIATRPETPFALVLAAASCYLAALIVTGIWFIPGVIAFNKVDVEGPASPALAEQGRRWQQRSIGRLVLMLAAAVLLTLALGA